MQLPSTKVLFAALAALALAAGEQIADDGIPTTLVGWLVLIGKALAAAGGVGVVGYRVTERRPPAALVAAVRSGQLPR